MARKKKSNTFRQNRYKFGTMTTAVLLGVMLGMFVGGILANVTDIENGTTIFYSILIPIFTSISVYAGVKSPIKTELVAYAVAVLLIFQWSWDLRVQDWNAIRTEIMITSILSVILNMFTGRVRLSGAKKTFKGQLGLK